jgi:hypothetical protein
VVRGGWRCRRRVEEGRCKVVGGGNGKVRGEVSKHGNILC